MLGLYLSISSALRLDGFFFIVGLGDLPCFAHEDLPCFTFGYDDISEVSYK